MVSGHERSAVHHEHQRGARESDGGGVVLPPSAPRAGSGNVCHVGHAHRLPVRDLLFCTQVQGNLVSYDVSLPLLIPALNL